MHGLHKARNGQDKVQIAINTVSIITLYGAIAGMSYTQHKYVQKLFYSTTDANVCID